MGKGKRIAKVGVMIKHIGSFLVASVALSTSFERRMAYRMVRCTLN